MFRYSHKIIIIKCFHKRVLKHDKELIDDMPLGNLFHSEVALGPNIASDCLVLG